MLDKVVVEIPRFAVVCWVVDVGAIVMVAVETTVVDCVFNEVDKKFVVSVTVVVV